MHLILQSERLACSHYALNKSWRCILKHQEVVAIVTSYKQLSISKCMLHQSKTLIGDQTVLLPIFSVWLNKSSYLLQAKLFYHTRQVIGWSETKTGFPVKGNASLRLLECEENPTSAKDVSHVFALGFGGLILDKPSQQRYWNVSDLGLKTSRNDISLPSKAYYALATNISFFLRKALFCISNFSI